MKIGFEIHQQLDTHKLFCNCPSTLREDPPDIIFKRRLRPTQSELGEIDRAALEEFLKGRGFIYEAYSDTTCLVEADEEPPHLPNEEAIDIALEVALLLHALPVEEVHFMRKIVIDGSNTSGFQRTAIIAQNGYLETESGKVGIPTICLEEEAARKMGEKDAEVIYRLDRLGIPLVEITTTPDIKSPEQAREVAKKIGELLRATGKVKRGIGTIRQDINISLEEGARVEIKGVQELNQIPIIIKNEIARQQRLIEVKEELERRGIKNLTFKISDVSDIFSSTSSKIIASQTKRGGKVLALKLEGFAGLMGSPLCALPKARRTKEEEERVKATKRLGPEFAQYAKVAAGVRGIFHSDELPAYGISEEEVEGVKEKLNISENDAFVLVAEEEEKAKKALEAVFKRAKIAISGVPEETRMANPDGTTSYMRPLPGAARMYPETDIPPVVITQDRLDRIASSLPELYEEKIERYMQEYSLSEELAAQMVRSERSALFEDIVSKINISPSIVANTLLGTLKDLKRAGIEVEKIPEARLFEIFRLVAENQMAKEAIPDVIASLAEDPEADIKEIVEKLGLSAFGESDIVKIVRTIFKEREKFIRERGPNAEKPLMGLVMKEVRGRADGKIVNQILRRELEKFLEKL
jgi:glutamyl-tRNA(Gln) amidotransferase subunit E